MRHRWLSFWLAACLLFTQAAGVHHVVSHLASEIASAGAHDQAPDQDQDRLCAQCLAFAAVDVALPAFALPPIITAREWHFPADIPLRLRSADAPPLRNRDPPTPVSPHPAHA